MNSFFINLLQDCAFLIIPIITILGGMWLFSRYEPNKKWISYLLFGILIALVGFEASFLGMLFDPDTQENTIISMLKEAGKIGFFAFFVGFVLLPVNGFAAKWSDKIFKPWGSVSRKDGKYGRRDF